MRTAWLPLLLLAGCSGGGSAPRPDMAMAKMPDLSSMGSPDLAMPGAADLAMPANCTATASYGDLGKKAGTGEGGKDNNGNQYVVWYGGIGGMPEDLMTVELYAGTGAFAGSQTLKTGTFQIAGDDLNYETCGLCVRILTDVDMGGNPTDTYLATGGTVTLTSVSGRITGSLSNVTFEHVQIDPNTFASTPDPSGCKSATSALSFDETIVMM